MSFAFFVFLTVLLAVLLIAEPVLGLRVMGRLERDVANGVPGARMRAYGRNIVLQWVGAAIFLAWWLALGRTPAEIGLHFRVSGLEWIAVAFCLALSVLVAVMTLRASRDPKSLDKVGAQLGRLSVFVPHTPAELRRFDGVSVSAGICEEIVYRGLLLTALTTLVGLWPAVLLSSVAFAAGHAYQGLAGALRVGLVGLVLALAVVFTGSLPVAMLMHVVLDMVQGRLLHSAVNLGQPEPEAAPA